MHASNRFTAPTRRYGAGKDKDALTVIIMAAAMTYRMKSFGPKCLSKIGDHTILENHIINIHQLYPNSEVILVVGFEADKVIKNTPEHVRIVENQLFESTGILEEARVALNATLNENVLLIDGNVQATLEELDTMTKSSCIKVCDTNKTEDCVGVTSENDKVVIFSHGLTPYWNGIVFLNNKELKLFRNFVQNREKNKMFVHEALNHIINSGGTLKVVK